jgi:hypothetical protein
MFVSLQLATPTLVPLIEIVLLPCVAPKPVPEIETPEPTDPEAGDKLLMVRLSATVKFDPLLYTPLANTTTFPVVAPLGTVVAMLVALQLVGVAGVPSKLSDPPPCVAPKFVPVIVTEAPTVPEVGERLVILGVGSTVKLVPLLATPPAAVTTTLPVVAPAGTSTTMLVALQLSGVTEVPLKLTDPLPCARPKLVPVIVTETPTAPEAGKRLVMLGAAVTVNVTPLLATPPAAVTTTFPVVAPVGTVAVMLDAPQLVIVVALVPLNFTLPVPCDGPKFDPAITIEDPMAPVLGVSDVTLGTEVTVNVTPLLATPPAAVTTTFPVVAPVGTVAVILDAPQLVIVVALVPLNFTLPVPCDGPKFDPAITIEDPMAPVLGVSDVTLGTEVTVNVTPLLATPPAAVTTTFPVVAPVGTVAVILDAPQLVIVVALVPLNFTLPVPCDGPKFDPAITIEDPMAPVLGVSDVMLGAEVTVSVTPLLATPPAAVTTTLPVVAPVGTVAVMLVAAQLVIVVALVPLNFTLPLPRDGPKFDPAITIDDPTAPVFGVSVVMLGAGVTVKLTPLLAVPTVTTTLPVVAPVGTVAVMLDAPQLVVVAVVPLNLTVLVPLVDPKFDPAMTMDDPTAPVLGVSDVMLGVVACTLTAKKNIKVNASAWLNFQLRIRIKPNLPRMNGRNRLIAFFHCEC